MKLLMIAIALLLPWPAAARRDPPTEFVQITAGVPVSIRPDKAYILYRVPQMKGAHPSDTVFYRERGSASGLTSANMTSARLDRWYAQTATERFYLIEAKPGSYVILGQAVKGVPYMFTCFCMGTLRFEAKPGELTDLGYLLSDTVSSLSPFPELRAVTGRGPRINDGTANVMAAAIRPVGLDATLPDALRGFARVPARFGPVGKLVNSFARVINRMAPLPGVLAYDEDRVIDARAEAGR